MDTNKLKFKEAKEMIESLKLKKEDLEAQLNEVYIYKKIIYIY